MKHTLCVRGISYQGSTIEKYVGDIAGEALGFGVRDQLSRTAIAIVRFTSVTWLLKHLIWCDGPATRDRLLTLLCAGDVVGEAFVCFLYL